MSIQKYNLILILDVDRVDTTKDYFVLCIDSLWYKYNHTTDEVKFHCFSLFVVVNVNNVMNFKYFWRILNLNLKIMNYHIFICTIFLFSNVLCENNVKIYSNENFVSQLDKRNNFVMFYAPW